MTIKPPETRHTDAAAPAMPPATRSAIAWILNAHSEPDILEALKAKHPEADPQRTLAAAVDEITSIGNEDPAFTRGWALAATRELVRKMIKDGDFANALKGIKQAAALSEMED